MVNGRDRWFDPQVRTNQVLVSKERVSVLFPKSGFAVLRSLWALAAIATGALQWGIDSGDASASREEQALSLVEYSSVDQS
jgi:hypothetical protein